MSAPHHLWLKPTGAAHERFAATIRTLAAELGAPVFAPHVTLLGHLSGAEAEHVRRTEALARRLRPFEIAITEVAYGDRYFQCVFLLVRPTPALMAAHAHARRTFGSPEKPYTPHVSLVYGSYPEFRKREIVSRLGDALRTTFTADAVYLIKAASDDPATWQEMLISPMTG